MSEIDPDWWDHLGITPENWQRAGIDAGLGVGHIWTEKRCPAYASLDPFDCVCERRT